LLPDFEMIHYNITLFLPTNETAVRQYRFLVALLITLIVAGTGRAAAIEVAVSIAPVHALIAAVMDSVAVPSLIVKGGASPHDYALRPSDATTLSRADVVFWIGPDLELFLSKPLASLADKANVVTLARQAGNGKRDSHIWLDPMIARDIVHIATTVLTRLDPANAGRYTANGDHMARRLDALDSELRDALAPVSALPYVVFHEAYGHFEQRYGLNRVAAITVNPQQRPGAKRIADIREVIKTTGARCLFTEPQFTPALAATIVEGTSVRRGTLDPLGVGLAPGAEAYFTIMRGLAVALRTCLLPPE
jgi:zinc transport system substrate-binding protein